MKKSLVITTALSIIAGSIFYSEKAYSLNTYAEVLNEKQDSREAIFAHAFNRSEDALRFNIKTRIESLKASGLEDELNEKNYWAYKYAMQPSIDLLEEHSKSLRELSKLITFAQTGIFPDDPTSTDITSACCRSYEKNPKFKENWEKGRKHFFECVLKIYHVLQKSRENLKKETEPLNKEMLGIFNGWLVYETLCEMSNESETSCEGRDAASELYENAVRKIINILTGTKKLSGQRQSNWNDEVSKELQKYILRQIGAKDTDDFKGAFEEYMRRDWDCYLVQTGVICPILFVDKNNQLVLYPEKNLVSRLNPTGSTSVLQKCKALLDLGNETENFGEEIEKWDLVTPVKDIYEITNFNSADFKRFIGPMKNDNEILLREDSNNTSQAENGNNDEYMSQNYANGGIINEIENENDNYDNLGDSQKSDGREINIESGNNEDYENEHQNIIINELVSSNRNNQFPQKNNERKKGTLSFLFEDSGEENEIMNEANPEIINENENENDNNDNLDNSQKSDEREIIIESGNNENYGSENQNIIEEEEVDFNIPGYNNNSSHLLKGNKKYVLEEKKDNPFLGGKKLKRVVKKDNDDNPNKTGNTDKDFRGFLKKNTNVIKKGSEKKENNNQIEKTFGVKLKEVENNKNNQNKPAQANYGFSNVVKEGTNVIKKGTEMEENNNQKKNPFGITLKKLKNKAGFNDNQNKKEETTNLRDLLGQKHELKEAITPDTIFNLMRKDRKMQEIMEESIMDLPLEQIINLNPNSKFDSVTDELFKRKGNVELLNDLIRVAKNDDASTASQKHFSEDVCKLARLFVYGLELMLLAPKHTAAVKLVKELYLNRLSKDVLQKYKEELKNCPKDFKINMKDVEEKLINTRVFDAAQLTAKIGYQKFFDVQGIDNVMYKKYKANCARSLLGDFILAYISTTTSKGKTIENITWYTTSQIN